jgi:probable F420-dependent oxidoreductase
MEIETVLPLGKVDPGLRKPEQPLDLTRVGVDAQRVESLGYDRLLASENKEDPFVTIAVAAERTTHLKLGTSVVIAFARSPAVTAMFAWSMQKLSRGRFTLGLGSQVKAHIQRRFGIREYTPAGTWMREYVQAVRAYWDCWQNGTPLDFHGARYDINLMVPQFNPGPIAHPAIPVHVAGVNPFMSQVAGEVADILGPHPICTRSYIEQVMLPAVAKGAKKAGRDPAEIGIAMRSLIATGPDEATLAGRIEAVRARVAFYASTPGYRAVFAHHGLEALAKDLSALSRAQRWEEMPPLIDDDMLHSFAVIGTYDQIVERMRERSAGLAASAEFSIPVTCEQDYERLADLIKQLKKL